MPPSRPPRPGSASPALTCCPGSPASTCFFVISGVHHGACLAAPVRDAGRGACLPDAPPHPHRAALLARHRTHPCRARPPRAARAGPACRASPRSSPRSVSCPTRAATAAPRPVVSLGWTLNYEMFFYLVFAAFPGAAPRGAAVAGVAASLALLVAFGRLAHPEQYGPSLLERPDRARVSGSAWRSRSPGGAGCACRALGR